MYPSLPRTRLLLLDIDGVLHPLAKPEDLHPNGWFCWLPILSEQLRSAPHVQIVVHSSWRTRFSLPELRQLLGPLGSRLIGAAPALPKSEAIASVLAANKGRIRDHLVLDDDPELARSPTLHVLQCDPRLGLSSRETQSALARWLNS